MDKFAITQSGIYNHYFGGWVRSADVDALLAEVRALVEACNEFFNPDKRLPDNLAEAFVMRRNAAEKVRQAIAAVDARLEVDGGE